MGTVPTPAEWRAAMGYFPTGVTVVTSWQDGRPVGTTINAFCSVSLEPPMLLICLNHINPLRDPVRESGVFGVNILGAEDGRALAMRFADPNLEDRFAGCAYRAVGDGAPQLETAPVFVDCIVEHIYDAGDHIIAVGSGIRTEIAATAPPLLYHKGKFPGFEPLA